MSELSTSELVGQSMLNIRGKRLGKVDRLLYQGDRNQPDWVMIKLGRLGVRRTIIPLEHVRAGEGRVQVIEEREWARDAPDVELDGERMTDEEADRLRAHYGLERLTVPTIEDGTELPRETRDAKPPAMDEGPGNPITERRRQRAEELGIPSTHRPAAARLESQKERPRI